MWQHKSALLSQWKLLNIIRLLHSALIFYVQRLPFMHTISRKISYRHAVAVSDRTKETMLAFANRCMLEYTKHGFEVANIHADKEFECLREKFENVSLEICGPDEHVPEVERSIRTMKEAMRATAHGLPYWQIDRIPSSTPGAEPPRDARDSGSARSHSTHLETSSSDRP